MEDYMSNLSGQTASVQRPSRSRVGPERSRSNTVRRPTCPYRVVPFENHIRIAVSPVQSMLEKDSDPTLKGHPEEISARPKIRVCFRPAQTHWKFGQN
jgi:hypothetical protein